MHYITLRLSPTFKFLSILYVLITIITFFLFSSSSSPALQLCPKLPFMLLMLPFFPFPYPLVSPHITTQKHSRCLFHFCMPQRPIPSFDLHMPLYWSGTILLSEKGPQWTKGIALLPLHSFRTASDKCFWGEYLDRREVKWREVRENCIMRSFVTRTLFQVQLEWSVERGWDGQSM
jgi:hypothetical protein